MTGIIVTAAIEQEKVQRTLDVDLGKDLQARLGIKRGMCSFLLVPFPLQAHGLGVPRPRAC